MKTQYVVIGHGKHNEYIKPYDKAYSIGVWSDTTEDLGEAQKFVEDMTRLNSRAGFTYGVYELVPVVPKS